MISKEIQAILNKQIQAEFMSSHNYLAMASWADQQGWKGVATFFYEQSEEERTHALKIVHFINDRDGQAEIPQVLEPIASFKNIHELFEIFRQRERDVTASINTVVDLCRMQKDYVSDQFMQWYLTEQLEEEILARDLLDELKIIGDDKGGLYSFDEKLKKKRGA